MTLASRTPYQYTRGMERIGFHPRSDEDEEEYDEEPGCLGVGAAHAVSDYVEDDEEIRPQNPYPRLSIALQIVTSDWGAGLAQGALIVALLWLVSLYLIP